MAGVVIRTPQSDNAAVWSVTVGLKCRCGRTDSRVCGMGIWSVQKRADTPRQDSPDHRQRLPSQSLGAFS